jgi:hypothetical protein
MIKRRERLEQYNEEYRLREQQGLSPPLASANLSSNEEEESDGGDGPSPIGRNRALIATGRRSSHGIGP